MIHELEKILKELEGKSFGENDYQIAISNQNIGKCELLKELIAKYKNTDKDKNFEAAADMWKRRFESTFEDCEKLKMQMGCLRTSARLQHERTTLVQRILKDVPGTWEAGVVDKSIW